MNDERSPGWYPDTNSPERYRYWDGEQWSRVSSSAPIAGSDDAPVDELATTPGPPVDHMRRWVIVLAAAAVAIVAVGALVFATRGGSDDDGHGGTGSAAGCSADLDELTGIVAAQTVGGSDSDAMTLTKLRCHEQWAAASASTGATTVFELQDGTWRLIAIGDGHPCDQLTLPAEAVKALGC